MLDNSAYAVKFKRGPQRHGSSTGAAGKITPGVSRVVSGVNASVIPSAMRAAAPSLGLADRIKAAHNEPAAVLKAAMASGKLVGLKAANKSIIKAQAKAYW
jgi:hypothetical protein